MDKPEFASAHMAALNPQQRAAVEAVHGPVLLLAVPGSGKTTVLITRLGYMTLVCGIPPQSILTMTYTVAATREMRARFAARFGDALAEQLEFRTINGVAARIIVLYSRMYNRTPPDLIQNESDTAPLLTRLWQETNHEYPTESTLKDLRTAITYIKNMCLTDDELDALETSTTPPWWTSSTGWPVCRRTSSAATIRAAPSSWARAKRASRSWTSPATPSTA